jgi:hypothetical protein
MSLVDSLQRVTCVDMLSSVCLLHEQFLVSLLPLSFLLLMLSYTAKLKEIRSASFIEILLPYHT